MDQLNLGFLMDMPMEKDMPTSTNRECSDDGLCCNNAGKPILCHGDAHCLSDDALCLSNQIEKKIVESRER